MVFYYKTTKVFVSQTVSENRLRFKFETFTNFSVPKEFSNSTINKLIYRNSTIYIAGI